MKKKYKYFILEIAIGALIGFFFLHPLSMLINGGMEMLLHNSKNNFYHMACSPMALYFTIIGIVLAALTATSRMMIQKKNTILEAQNKEINQKNIEIELQNQELIKLNADKNSLLSIIGHDLKNQFQVIFILSELLKASIPNCDINKTERQVTLIYSSAKHALHLLEDLLMWSRIQSDKLLFNPERLNLKNMCLEIIENLTFSASNKEIKISYYASQEIDIMADKNMIKAILRNLISNAIKFTDNGGKINVSIERSYSNAMIIITDNGIGIKPDRLSKLFDNSQNQTTVGTENEKGTGFGLLLCKDFVELHGGKIWVESEYGMGSSFKFTLPMIPNHLQKE